MKQPNENRTASPEAAAAEAKRRAGGRRIVLWTAVAVLLLAAAGIILLRNSISRALYDERRTMLTLVTETAADIVNENISMEWNQVEIIGRVVTDALQGGAAAEEAIRQSCELLAIEAEEYFFLVDENGKYYASDGTYGKMTDLTPFTSDTADRTEYIATLPHLDPTITYLIFRERLVEPIRVQTEHGETEVRYFAYAHSLAELREKVSNLFAGATNVFIYDESGAMLYKEFGIRLLLEGYNIYPKFALSGRPYGEEPEALIAACKNRESLTVELTITDEEYYFCSAPLDAADWSLAFIVQEAYIGDMQGGGLGRVVLSVSVLVILMGALVVAVVAAVLRRRAGERRLAESEQVAAALAEASRAKSDFLSNMSHDIRTPINGIMGMTTIAMSAADNPDKVRSCLGKIDGASHHLLSLINDVLDMSRIERGKTTIHTDRADIRALCDNCGSIIRGQLVGRTLDFEMHIDAQDTRLYIDELHLRRVLINILGNAIKFTRDGGSVTFLCRQTDGDEQTAQYRFEIRDTGIGMSPEFREHIFEAFSQEETGERTQYKGTGLGMAITKQLVELMGGTIEVESEKGLGSCFVVTLSFEKDLSVTEDRSDAVLSTNLRGVRILLAEDNELNMEIATELLTEAGAEVDPAVDGQEALERFRSQPAGRYDIILMDIMMPRMTGLEAAGAIRRLERPDAQTIPIVAMTANAFDEDVRASREAGMNAHLSKPIDIREVIRAVASFCKK